MNWKAISFYTDDYKEEADVLIWTLKRLNIPCDVERLSSKGLWKKNTFQKLPFIMRKLKEYNHPLVWLDADARVVQYPKLFDTLENVGMAGICTPLKEHEFCSNTMYFAPTEEVFVFLKEVLKFIKEVPNIGDMGEQDYLASVIKSEDRKKRLNFVELPYSYGIPSYWGELKKHKCYTEEPVIIQRQVSRSKDPIRKASYEKLGLTIGEEDVNLKLKGEKDE